MTHKDLMFPGFLGAGLFASGDGWGDLAEPFILDRGEHAQRAVAALPVVEDLQVLEDRVGQFDAGAPPPSVELLGLHRPQNDSIMPLS